METTIFHLNYDCLGEVFMRMQLIDQLSLANASDCFRPAYELCCKSLVKEVWIVKNQCHVINSEYSEETGEQYVIVKGDQLFAAASNCIKILSISRHPTSVLQIPSLKNLQELVLRECERFSNTTLIRMFRFLHQIKSLELWFSKRISEPVITELEANAINLQHLAIYTRDQHVNLDFIANLPSLNSLDIYVGRRTLRSLLTALSDINADRLKALIIRSNDCTYKDLCLTANLRKLKRLGFPNPGKSFISEHTFHKLCELEDLEELYIYNHAPTVNENGTLYLMENSANLKYLALCPNIAKRESFICKIIHVLRSRLIKQKSPLWLDIFNYKLTYEEKIMVDEAVDVLNQRTSYTPANHKAQNKEKFQIGEYYDNDISTEWDIYESLFENDFVG